MNEYILEMNNITKTYGNGVRANTDVNFNLKKGEIHALVGENGAGKSTLMKILFGMETPSKGELILKGKIVQFSDSKDAISAGIGMVHQHFMLVESFIVAQNIVLGIEPQKNLFVNSKQAIDFTEEISKKYNLEVDAKEITKNLPIGIKQKVEILKALARGAEILILDEPTAVLTPQETYQLPFIVDKAFEKGMYIVLNPSPFNEELKNCDFKKISMFFINEIEGNQITGADNPENIINTMKEKYPQSQIVLTLGESGVWYVDENKLLKEDALKIKVIDTTAAGDTFTGYFVSGMIEQTEVQENLKRSTKAAAIAVSRKGAMQSIPLKEEVI